VPPFGVMLMLTTFSLGMCAKVGSARASARPQSPRSRAILQTGQLWVETQSLRSWRVWWNSYIPHRPSADAGTRHGTQVPVKMRLQDWQQAALAVGKGSAVIVLAARRQIQMSTRS